MRAELLSDRRKRDQERREKERSRRGRAVNDHYLIRSVVYQREMELLINIIYDVNSAARYRRKWYYCETKYVFVLT